MEKIEELILLNNFNEIKDYLISFEDKESELRDLVHLLCDEYGLFVVYMLVDLAYSRNIPFWFNQVGYLLSFSFSHIDGAERMALAMFKKSFEFDSNDITILEAILDFKSPPEIILTDSEFQYYSKLLKQMKR